MGWREIVERARAEENKEVAALVLSDKGLQKLLAALVDGADRDG